MCLRDLVTSLWRRCRAKRTCPHFSCGLLKKANLADECIRAFETIESEIPEAQLWIVGRGAQRDKLEAMANGLNVKFFGYVDEARKLDLMQRAHAVLVPGIREGWGMVITEANACGTPAIAYDIVGYWDAVRDGETGLLTEATPKRWHVLQSVSRVIQTCKVDCQRAL